MAESMGGRRFDRFVGVLMAQSRHEELRRLAETRHVSVSALVREATDRLLEDTAAVAS